VPFKSGRKGKTHLFKCKHFLKKIIFLILSEGLLGKSRVQSRR
jgi:hypothetical protein